MKTYMDQDGTVWDASYAVCPTCEQPNDLSDRVRGSGYFRCCCGIQFDEPLFIDAEYARMSARRTMTYER